MQNIASNSKRGMEAAKNSTASKPFVVSAIVLVFAGSSIGSVWMMSLFGVHLPVDARAFSLHRTLQVDGFLTMLIMGIGYMIVPRFRNMTLPSRKLAYASFALVAGSVVLSIVSLIFAGNNILQVAANASRLAGVVVFAGTVFWMARNRPRLLALADYFALISVSALVALAAMRASGYVPQDALAEVQSWLLFPVLMIFGVEYKTIPSFLGFIRPRKRLSYWALALAGVSAVLGVAAAYSGYAEVHFAFNIAFIASAILLAMSLYIFGGFDNSEILELISGEKKARYTYTVWYARISFLFLFAAIVCSAVVSLGEKWGYLLYDLAIHYTAIGFVGVTIALYLPLMLPPITGRAVHFVRFNHLPVALIIAALALRAAGDAAIVERIAGLYAFAASGWMVVAALAIFVAMIHRSMQGPRKNMPQLG